MSRFASGPARNSPPGMTGIGIFLVFGAFMAPLAGLSLGWPGSGLDQMWRLNPRAYSSLAPLGRWIGIAFFLLGLTMAIAAVGWFQRQLWGWKLTVGIIATQVIGNAVNLLLGR